MEHSPKRRILFFDDEPLVLKGLQRTLRSMRKEWDLDFAGSGLDALNILSSESYDAVVTDMRMREKHAIECVVAVGRGKV